MIYFKKTTVDFGDKSLKEAEAALLGRTSKAGYLFDLHKTTAWVVFKERQFLGKRTGEGEYKVSRYRHVLFTLVPRVVARVNFEKMGTGSKLTINTRLNIGSTILFGLLNLALFLPLISALVRSGMPGPDAFSPELACVYLYFLGAAYYETKLTETMLTDVIRGQDIKSIFSA